MICHGITWRVPKNQPRTLTKCFLNHKVKVEAGKFVSRMVTMLDVFFSLRCPDCGGKIKEEERYCPHSGVDLDAPITPTEAGSGDTVNSPARQHFRAAQKGYEITTEAGLRDALINCDLALQYDPNFADAHNLRGLALDEMGRIEEAIAAYRKALQLNPDLGEARINLEDAEAELASQSAPESANQSIGFIEESEPRSSGSGKYIMWILAALMVSYALLFGFTQIQKFANAYLLPKTTVVFISDVPDGVTVEQADLEKAAQVLSERSERLGYSNVTFEVSTAGEIVGMIPVTVDAVKFAEQVGDVGILEFVFWRQRRIALRLAMSSKSALHSPRKARRSFWTIPPKTSVNFSGSF